MSAPLRRIDTWEPLGDVIARLKARVDQAIADRDEEAGAEAHVALIEAEQRQLLIEPDENDELDDKPDEEGDDG